MARTRPVYFWTDDELDQIDRLAEAATLAANDDTRPAATMMDGDPAESLRAEYESAKAALEQAAKADGRYAVLRELGRNAWREVRAKNPPRDDNKGDSVLGFNTDTVEDDLVRAAVIEPTFTTDAEFDAWAEDQGNSAWALLAATAWELTNGERRDPKPLPASLTRSTEQN